MRSLAGLSHRTPATHWETDETGDDTLLSFESMEEPPALGNFQELRSEIMTWSPQQREQLERPIGDLLRGVVLGAAIWGLIWGAILLVTW